MAILNNLIVNGAIRAIGNVTAPTFVGTLSGNATSATKATQDGNGAVIASTYFKKTDTLPVSQLSWAGNVNLSTTASADGQEWSIDLSPGSYNNTYWHVWSTKRNGSILCCYPDNNSVTIPNGPLTVGGATTINNCIHVNPGSNSNWAEGIRIHSASNGWTTLVLCGTDNTGANNTSANSWSFHTYNGNFYISRNGSSSSSSAILKCESNVWTISPSLSSLVVNGTVTIGGITTINNALYCDVLYTGSAVINGDCAIGGVLRQSSDKRLKKHISYLDTDAVNFIKKLKPAYYTKNKKPEVGLYAQDVDSIDVWRCMVSKEGEYYNLSYTEIIAPLITYCQHLEKRIEQLESKVGE